MKRVIVKPAKGKSPIAPDGRRVPEAGWIVDLDAVHGRWWRKRIREGGLTVHTVKASTATPKPKKTTKSTTEETEK